jgi:hypothetical protein
MKVYAVFFYGDSLEGIFSTREAAEAFVRGEDERGFAGPKYYAIREYILRYDGGEA